MKANHVIPQYTPFRSYMMKDKTVTKEQQTIGYTMPPISDSLRNLMGIEINRVLQGAAAQEQIPTA